MTITSPEFIPLVIAEGEGADDGTGMEFGDGSFGVPYIVANNVEPPMSI